MAPPPFVIPNHPHGMIFPNMFPPLLPPPPPTPHMLRNLRNNGFAFPVLPRIPRAQHSCRPKKIINIIDPHTGQDITEELLSSVTKKSATEKSHPLKKVNPPIRSHRRPPMPMSSPMPIPLSFVRKAPPPTQVIMKCVPDPEFFWEDDYRWRSPNSLSPFLGSCSWPPNAPNLSEESTDFREPRKRYQSVCANNKNIVKYNRDVLLSLRHHPLASEKPKGLPDLEVIKKESYHKLPEKQTEKFCNNGAQTVMPRSAFDGKSQGAAIGFKRSFSNRKSKLSSTPKKELNDQKKTKAPKSPINLDRGDRANIDDIVEKFEKISIG